MYYIFFLLLYEIYVVPIRDLSLYDLGKIVSGELINFKVFILSDVKITFYL
jgi:hypothetical protein